MVRMLAWIADHLIYLVFVVAAVSLIFPAPGSRFSWIVAPVLALMVLSVSMTIDLRELLQVTRYPLVIAWSFVLQFVLMALFSIVLGKIFFSALPDMNSGQVLLGALPADISAPLMVSLVGGNTALGMGMLVSAMVLTPFVLPTVLSVFGGVSFPVPVLYLEAELVGIILVPLAMGIILNHYSAAIREKRDAWPGCAALWYLLLLCVVISSNALSIFSLGRYAILILALELSLNFFGYGLAYLAKRVFSLSWETFLPLLFIAGTKEFGIAPAAVDVMELNRAIVIPSAFYAVVQMISCPVLVKVVNCLTPEKPVG